MLMLMKKPLMFQVLALTAALSSPVLAETTIRSSSTSTSVEAKSDSGPTQYQLNGWLNAGQKRESLRIRMVREAAMSAAMRAGLAKQGERINKMLMENQRNLDDIFDFSSLMLPNNVVPPRIRYVENIVEQQGGQMRNTKFRLEVVQQAHFSTRAPTWRTYLTIPVWSDLGSTHQALLPQNSDEVSAAQRGLQEGWEAGERQANEMFMRGLNRLHNDLMQMFTYHAALKVQMVSMPIINRKDVPVTGDGNVMSVDQSTYSIESLPSFNPKMIDWLAVIDSNPSLKSIQSPVSAAEQDRVRTVPDIQDLRAIWGANAK